MKIEKYGVSSRIEYAAKRLSELGDGVAPTVERIILLPIPTTRDGIRLTGCEVLISDILISVEAFDAVIGYAIPREDIEIIEAKGAMCIDLANDGEFLLENARLTALGAVGYILSNVHRALDESRVGVVGYGRIGERLVAYLTALGADVTVYTSKNATRVELGALGIKTESYDRAEGVLPLANDVDVLINTAPTSLAATFPTGAVPSSMTVIELASGKNFEGISGVVTLPSLPERIYPDSAAKIYYRAIMRSLSVAV